MTGCGLRCENVTKQCPSKFTESDGSVTYFCTLQENHGGFWHMLCAKKHCEKRWNRAQADAK